MTTDDPSSLPIPSDPDPEKNLAETGQSGTFGDIDPSYGLSAPQCRAIELVLAGLRWSQIAKSLEINRKTLWRWKTQDPNFQKALAEAREDRRDSAADRCQSLAFRAAQLLLQSAARFALPDPTPPPEPWPLRNLPFKLD